ncbi:hypothetical protein BO71DRAFT_192358 [Aspergillus ellipticus CBS 707.79]|uniref:Uncharacterized protein n=1 Tax=Aspergillus ellipticus CBS 707.79 TaxID=1448320 RepID=A0A319DSX6_9EURO|nr:hypothetical protein BO71DRAFT_192358 [Aspergillus ellipticus CBS 707.79]
MSQYPMLLHDACALWAECCCYRYPRVRVHHPQTSFPRPAGGYRRQDSLASGIRGHETGVPSTYLIARTRELLPYRRCDEVVILPSLPLKAGFYSGLTTKTSLSQRSDQVDVVYHHHHHHHHYHVEPLLQMCVAIVRYVYRVRRLCIDRRV